MAATGTVMLPQSNHIEEIVVRAPDSKYDKLEFVVILAGPDDLEPLTFRFSVPACTEVDDAASFIRSLPTTTMSVDFVIGILGQIKQSAAQLIGLRMIETGAERMQYIFTHLGAAERWLDKAKNIPPPSTVSLGPDPSELLSGLRRTRVDALWRADKAIKKSVKKMRKLLGGLREDEIISNEDHDNLVHIIALGRFKIRVVVTGYEEEWFS